MEPHIGEADWCVSDPNGRCGRTAKLTSERMKTWQDNLIFTRVPPPLSSTDFTAIQR